MGKLIIKGEAKVTQYINHATDDFERDLEDEGDENYEDEFPEDYDGSGSHPVEGLALSVLDGVAFDGSSDYKFSEYFDEEQEGFGVSGGYLRFEYDPKERKLYAVTEYKTERHLTDAEAQIIADYTQGQWSDGIGESFEQFPVCRDGDEYYLSASHYGQVLQITQED